MGLEKSCELSIIITVVGGEKPLRKCLDLLIPQVTGRPFEVIVPYDATVEEIGNLASVYPQICFLKLGSLETGAKPGSLAAIHELYDKRPAPDWCEQISKAHQDPHGVIGGSVEQVGSGILNWAIYFPDFGRYQLPLEEGPVNYLTDINVSYKRESLYLVKEVWAKRYNEVSVHWALIMRGVGLWRRPQMVVHLDRGNLAFRTLIHERYAWGRLFGCMRSKEISLSQRFVYFLSSPLIPILLIGRMARKTLPIRRNRNYFLKAFPYIFTLTCLWSLGEVVGTITGRDS
jgi:hypothetical protein